MTKRKLIWLILIFVVYEVLVWTLPVLFLPESNYVLIGIVLTACGVTVASVYWLVARLSAMTRPTAAAAGPATAEPPTGSALGGQDDDAAAISALIREANQKLALSPTLASQRAKSRVSDFPLYLLVGAEGTGKTSAFLASELEPELLAGQVYRDSVVASTRLGNIWFTRGAVVVEAGGVLFSSEGGRWNRLLSSLLSSRQKSPWARLFAPSRGTQLGGVVLCCDAATFVGVPDAAKIGALARVTQQRLRAIGEILGHDFPVYVVFTKSDAIKSESSNYFADYFGRLTINEDQQILGCSLPAAVGTRSREEGVYAETEAARISAGLSKLYLSLAEKRLVFLARETDKAKKPSIYEFPREFKRMRSNLVQFLIDAFRPNPLQPNPVLNGLYFTGTRKVAERLGAAPSLPVDRTIIHRVGDVTRMLRLEDLEKLRSAVTEGGPREPEITRWAFCAKLWQKILGSQRGAAPTYVNRQEQIYRKVIFGAASVLSALATLLFLGSFLQNRALVHGIASAIAQTEPLPRGATASLSNLRELDALRLGIDQITNDGPGVFGRLGFYEGKRLVDPALHAYFARFREYLLDPVVNRLDAEFSSLPSQEDPAHSYRAIYGDLKIYRTVTRSGAEAGCVPDTAAPDDLALQWRAERQPQTEADRIVRANARFYLSALRANRVPDEFRSLSKDDAVRRARDYLNAFRGVEPQYHRIIDQVNGEKQSSVSLAELTGNPNYRSVLRAPDGVPAAFTRSAWDRVQELIKGAAAGASTDSCVLGTGASRASNLFGGPDVEAQLRDLYIKDYIQQWSDFLAKTNAVPYGGCGDAVQKLDVLKDNNSPILGALLIISENTTFPKRASSTASNVAQTLQSGGKGLRDSLKKVKDAGRSAVAKALGETPGDALTEDAITAFFQPVHAVFEASPPKREHWTDARNTPYLEALGGLERSMQGLDRGGKCDINDQAANNAASAEVAKAQGAVDTLARNFDNQGSYESVKNLLEAPIRGVRPWINTDPAKPTIQRINASQQQLCQALGGLRGRYPFDTQARDDARLELVASVFDPRMGQFALVRQSVSDQVVRTAGGWVQKPDATVKLSRTFLDFLGRMSAISDALFGPQGTGPARYKLSVRPNPGVKQIVGILDGEPFSMAAKEYAWPPSQPGINLRVEQTGGGSTALRSYSGIWAIFQLLGNADHAPGTNLFSLTNLQGDARSNLQPILPDGSSIYLEVSQFPNGIQRAFERGFFAVSCPARATQ